MVVVGAYLILIIVYSHVISVLLLRKERY